MNNKTLGTPIIGKTPLMEAGGKAGHRPLRLIAYMNVKAGADQEVASRGLYNYRKDVELTMMHSITDNLVVGIHDERIWSEAITQKYPDTVKYYGQKWNGGKPFYADISAGSKYIITYFWMLADGRYGCRTCVQLAGNHLRKNNRRHGYCCRFPFIRNFKRIRQSQQ